MAESTGSRLTRYDEFWDVKPANFQSCDNNFGGVSIWCDRYNKWELIRNMREGDRLESLNSNPPHLHSLAIYKSANKLNHFDWSAVQFCNRANEEGGVNSTRNTFLNVEFPASKNVFVVTPILMFLVKPGSKVRINNLKDYDLSPLSTRHICKEVTYQLKELHESDAGNEVYMYVCRNQFKDSEDFVNYCRYDRDHQHNYRRDNNYGRLGEWYSEANIEDFTHEVHVGDRLEFRGSFPYERWGIYIGQQGDDSEQVVLFAHGNKTSSATSTERLKPNLCVKFTLKHVVAGCDQIRINNGDDWKWPPLDKENILNGISRQLADRAHTYYDCRVSFKDSEGFVNYCRYDYRHINFGLVSKWSDHPSSLPLQVGDRLEFDRTALPYRHWGIYLGQWGADRHQVVHSAPADENETIFKKKASGSGSSAKDKLVLLVDNICTFRGKVRINNEGDRMFPPLDRENILKEIRSQLSGRKRTQNECKLSFNDSKDFVNHCRYDDWRINFGLVSDWCGLLCSLPLHVGDRLEFHCTGRPYAHWGIYLGDWGADHNQVVHFAPPADGNGKLFFKLKSFGSEASAKDKPVLCVDHIWHVVGKNKVRINNERDHIWPPFNRTYILDKIKRQLKSQSDGDKPVYRLFSNNCEHFVNHCRYGKQHSDQVRLFSRNRDHVTKDQLSLKTVSTIHQSIWYP